MSLFTKLAAAIFAPTDAGGNKRQIIPHDAQVWGTELERAISAKLSAGGLVYATKADLDADLDHPENTSAWVVADPIDANNGIYGKVGASGTGSWEWRMGLPVGEEGPPGPPGADGDITWEGAWQTSTDYTANEAVENGGSSYVCILNHTADASNEPGVGASWETYWSLMAAKGADGSDGDAATIGVGNVTTLDPGQPATVTNVGTEAAAIFNFGIPRGQDGTGIGDMTKAVYDPGNVAGNAFNGFPVTSRADLKLLDTAQFSAVYLLEADRQGPFQWDASDLSAEVAADTDEFDYVAPPSDPTGAAGAWVRRYNSDVRSAGAEWELSPNFVDEGDGFLSRVLQGSPSVPVNTAGAPYIVQKHSNTAPISGSAQNAAVFVSHKKNTSETGTKAVGLMAETVDNVGGTGTFVEGTRSHALLASGSANGSAYGVLAAAMGEAGVSYKYLVAAEGGIRNNNTDAAVGDIPPAGPFAVSFLASNPGTFKANAGFATNPNSTDFRYGFLAAAGGQDVACFAGFGTATYGLDLNGFTGNSAIRIGNLSPFVARNAANSANVNVLYLSSSDVVVLGAGASGLQVRTSSSASPKTVTEGVDDSGGTGFKVLRVPN